MIKSSQTCVHGAETHKHFGGVYHLGSHWSLWHWKEACITSLSWQFYILEVSVLRSKTCSRCVRCSIWIFFNCTECSMIEVLLIVKGATLVCVYWAEKVSKSVLRLGSLTFQKNKNSNSASELWRQISINTFLWFHMKFVKYLSIYMWDFQDFRISISCLPSQYLLRWLHKALFLAFRAAIEDYIEVREVNAKSSARNMSCWRD